MSGSAENVVLTNDYGRVVISPGVGGSLRSLRVRRESGEIELLAGGHDSHDPGVLPSGTGSFIMAPWVNRILNGRLKGVDGALHSLPVNSGIHAIHGTLRRAPWDVTRVSDTELECRIALSSPWPWSGSVTQTIALIDHSIRMTLRVESLNDEFPAGVGWHPWFNRTLDGVNTVSVKADVGDEWELDDSMTPTGNKALTETCRRLNEGGNFDPGDVDSCLDRTPGGSAILTWPQLTLTVEMSEEISHLMAYSPDHAFCLEPQTTAVNAFQLADQGNSHTGTRIVTPGRPLHASTTWTWS